MKKQLLLLTLLLSEHAMQYCNYLIVLSAVIIFYSL